MRRRCGHAHDIGAKDPLIVPAGMGWCAREHGPGLSGKLVRAETRSRKPCGWKKENPIAQDVESGLSILDDEKSACRLKKETCSTAIRRYYRRTTPYGFRLT